VVFHHFNQFRLNHYFHVFDMAQNLLEKNWVKAHEGSNCTLDCERPAAALPSDDDPPFLFQFHRQSILHWNIGGLLC
jgi:hypothetical protein